MRVLIVESADCGRFLAQQMLADFDANFQWQQAANDEQLRTLTEAFRPRLVFCADEMPRAARTDALRLLRLLALRDAEILLVEVGAAEGAAPLRAQIESEASTGTALPGFSAPSLQDARARLPALLGASDEVVAMSDAAGWITYANAEACRVLDLSCEQVVATLLGGEYDFAAPGYRPHRLVRIDWLTGLPTPLHVSDLLNAQLLDSSTAQALGAHAAFPLVAFSLDGLWLNDASEGCALGDELLDLFRARFAAAPARCGLIAQAGRDDLLLVLPPPTNAVRAALLAQSGRTPVEPAGIADAPGQALAARLPVPTEAHSNQPVWDPNTLTDEVWPTAISPRPVSMAQGRKIASTPLPFIDAAPPAAPASVEARLDDALKRDAIGVHYQPQFELLSGRGCGVEALARWVLTSGESVVPAVFIPAAEQSGMIGELGEYVLRKACDTAAAWKGRECERMTLSVNVSALQVNERFTAALPAILQACNFPAQRLELEIAESVLVANRDVTLHCLEEWKRLGVRVAVSHAGENYSNLSYLSRLSINRLKLQRSLIQRLPADPRAENIVGALIALGVELGVEVIAEGIETRAQFETLLDLGCLQGQGYFFGRPMPAVPAQLMLRKPWGHAPPGARVALAASAAAS